MPGSLIGLIITDILYMQYYNKKNIYKKNAVYQQLPKKQLSTMSLGTEMSMLRMLK